MQHKNSLSAKTKAHVKCFFTTLLLEWEGKCYFFFLGGGGEMLLVLFNLIVTNLKKNLEDGKMTLSNDTKAIS